MPNMLAENNRNEECPYLLKEGTFRTASQNRVDGRSEGSWLARSTANGFVKKCVMYAYYFG